jgi:hypothetical protein
VGGTGVSGLGKHFFTLTAMALAGCFAVCGAAEPAPVNALPNGGFELTEPGASGRLIPRTWTIRTSGDSYVEVVPRQPDGHCLRLVRKGTPPRLHYDGFPIKDTTPWTLTFETRGTGKLRAQVSANEASKWTTLLDKGVNAVAEWETHRFTIVPSPTATAFRLQFSADGELFLDNVLFGHPRLPGLNLPPSSKLTADADTLLLLDFETDLDPFQYFIKGDVERTEDGRFGAALRQGADAYVATSAEDFLDSHAGTIELWVKLLVPGGERVSRPFVSVPGMRGLSLVRDQYGHISFSIQRHWGVGVRVWADGYARTWEPNVWRHVAACWDNELVQLWVDGRLLHSAPTRNVPDSFGPELRLGAPGMVIDDLRISRTVRYRFPVPSSQ